MHCAEALSSSRSANCMECTARQRTNQARSGNGIAAGAAPGASTVTAWRQEPQPEPQFGVIHPAGFSPKNSQNALIRFDSLGFTPIESHWRHRSSQPHPATPMNHPFRSDSARMRTRAPSHSCLPAFLIKQGPHPRRHRYANRCGQVQPPQFGSIYLDSPGFRRIPAESKRHRPPVPAFLRAYRGRCWRWSWQGASCFPVCRHEADACNSLTPRTAAKRLDSP